MRICPALAFGSYESYKRYSWGMKKCAYCGQEYPDDAVRCSTDGELLSGGGQLRDLESVTGEESRKEATPRPAQADSAWRPRLIDLRRVEGAFDFEEGFSRPNWKVIGEAIQHTVSTEDLPGAWTEAALQWVEQVRSDLGTEYLVRSSRTFILLSALGASTADQLLAFAEGTLDHIYATLKDAAWRSGYGKHVILLFTEDDDYYQYVSYFYSDGIHPTSGGCLIPKDYVHIAMPYLDGRNIRRVLLHELVHNSVVHLPLPLWLNEGLAVVLDRTAATGRQTMLDHELRDRHLAFWNSENIQKFWSGISFGEPGDSTALSYSLADILVYLLLSQSKEFVAFLKEAHWEDAGQTAAVDVLGTDLGQTAATFLGEGNWRPNRKAMVDCWKATKTADEKPHQSPGRRYSSHAPALVIHV